MGHVKKILMMAYGGLGDVIFLLPAIQALRKHFTGVQITYVTSGETAGANVLQDLAGIPASNLRFWPWTVLKQRKEQINHEIIADNYDLAVIPYTAPVRHYMKGLRSIPLRVGHCRSVQAGGFFARLRLEIWEEELFRKMAFNRKVWISQNGEHEIDMALRLAYAAGVPSGASRIPEIETSVESDKTAWKFLMENGAKEGDSLVGFQLGISPAMSWKQWGAEKFASVASGLAEKGNKIILFGSDAERDLAASFSKVFPYAIHALGLRLSETAALIKRCRLFVANDSGPAKLAMALGVKTAIIWGPSDRFGAGPWQDGCLTLATGISCSPCFALGLTKSGLNHNNCGHRNCLRQLTPETILKKISLP